MAGQVALDHSGRLIGANDPDAQIRQVFTNILSILRAAGGESGDLVKLTTYDTDIDAHAETLRRIRREFLGDHLPASTKVQVQRLADPRYLIEIDAIAVLGED